MPSVKITELPLSTQLSSNTSNTVFVGVNLDNQTTSRFTTSTLAAGLFAHAAVNVGTSLVFSDASTQSVAAAPANYTQSAFDAANTAANNILVIEGVNTSQNNYAAAVNQYAGAAFNTANGANDLAAGAYNKANNALANTTGTFAGDLTITGQITVNDTINGSNVAIGNQIEFTSNATIRTTTGTGTEKDIVIITGDELSTTDGGSVTIQTGAGTLTGRGGNINLISGIGGLGRGTIHLFGNTVSNGTFNVLNSNFDANSSLINITAADGGATVSPSNSYYMLHITGKANNAARVVIDSFGVNTYPLVSGRMGRGSASMPAAVANNDVLMRIVGNGYTGTQFPSSSPTKIDFVATENFSDTNRGTAIQFWNTPIGSNTIQRIATFNANEVSFTGALTPQKGFIYTPKSFVGAQTAITIDFSNDTVVRAQTATGLTVTLSNYVYGKVVEVWITNTAGSTQAFVHGCSATNSTTGGTSYNMPGNSTILAKYMSFDGDLANTFVSIIHA